MTETQGSWRDHPAQWRLAKLIAGVTWRSVESDDTASTGEGPVLLVANHFGGAADVVVLMNVLPRRPRILADDKIWTFQGARQFMDWLGAIPVHRGRGGEGSDNADMFAACHEALAEEDMLLIFPEGITREQPSIGKVRTGAARIAIGARAAGVRGIRIVPVGLHYDDKAAFRSSVYVHQGVEIDLDSEVQAVMGDVELTAADQQHVEQLTGLIEERLREVAPDYSDWHEARSLQLASEAFLRTLDPTTGVPAAPRNRLAAWLARDEDAPVLVESAERYRIALDHAGVSDTWAVEGSKRVNLRSIGVLVGWILMLPYAVLGAIMCAVPIALTWTVSKVRLAPAVVASILPLVGVGIFTLATAGWMVAGWFLAGFVGLLVVPTVFIVSFVALMLVAERGHLWLTGLHNRLFSVGGNGRGLAAQRRELVDAVAAKVLGALGGTQSMPPGGQT